MESLLGGGATGAAPGLMVGLMASLSMMISSWEKSDRAKDDYKDKNQNYGDTFDFIIGELSQLLPWKQVMNGCV